MNKEKQKPIYNVWLPIEGAPLNTPILVWDSMLGRAVKTKLTNCGFELPELRVDDPYTDGAYRQFLLPRPMSPIRRVIKIVADQRSDGAWYARIPECPGSGSKGETYGTACGNVIDAMIEIEAYRSEKNES